MKLARMPDGRPEIFFTLQGEGRNIGRPSIFIRSSLCNLHCHWCDTDYTWNWQDTHFSHEKDADPSYQKYRREEQIIDCSAGDIVTAVSRYPCRHFVFTGGEPLIQEKAWTMLMSALKEADAASTFEIETNGTLFPGPEFLDCIDQINVSPKLANSMVPEQMRTRPEVLRQLAETGKADFKFVVSSRDELGEILALLKKISLPPDRVFLMPKANSVIELEANQAETAALAQSHGFRYSDRLHLRLFGAKRGV